MPCSPRRSVSLATILCGLLVALFVALFVASPGLAQAPPDGEPAGMTARDLWSFDRISDPRPSPDGLLVVYTLRSTDFEADRGRTDLWAIPFGSGTGPSGPPMRLTTHEASDSSPRWLPDGSGVLFLSSRSGSSQVWRLPLDGRGGEATPVTDLPLDVEAFVISPDGSRIAVSLDVFPDCESLECTVDRLAEREEADTTGRVYDRLFVRHWDTWEDGRRRGLFVLPVEPGEGEGSTAPVALTPGLDADVPSRPFGGDEEITFTPDGTGVVFTARLAGAGEPWSTNFDLWHVPTDGSAPPRRLTANPAWDTQPVFSPAGDRLVYLAMERPGFEADRLQVMSVAWPPPADGMLTPRSLTADWDRSPGGLVWSADGRHLYATAADVGQVSLFRIDASSGAVERLLADGHVRGLQRMADGAGDAERLVFGLDSLTSPVELHVFDTGGDAPAPGRLTRITDVNGGLLDRVAMGDTEQFSFAGWNGETVYGWVVAPPGVDLDAESGDVPLAFLIHGGPQGSFGNDFHYRWNPQAYAGAGYAAVMIDFHGSVGYGQDFTDSITGDWGGKPLEDLQKGLAAALERYPWIDGDRVCALGASYGGYMVNWIAGNWSDRFRCLVNHDGVFDTRSMYFTTEELWFPEWEMGGPYWVSPEGHEKHNPALHVEGWESPMLVIHGALDFRVPETQGLAAFTALQRRGVESRLLYFPDENHWVLSPANGIQWHDEVLGWLDRWLEAE